MMGQLDATDHPTASADLSHELMGAMDVERLKKTINFHLWIQRFLLALIPVAVALGVALAR